MAATTESPLSVTFRPHGGYDAPLITVRADDPSELEARLEGVKEYFELMAETQGVLVAAWGLKAPAPAEHASPKPKGSWGNKGGGGPRTASPKQVDLVLKLAAERDTSNLPAIPERSELESMPGKAVSDIIDALFGAPEKSGSKKAWG